MMSKPSAVVKRDPRHVPPQSEVLPSAKQKEPIVVSPAGTVNGSSLDPAFPTIHLVFWWKKAPDPLLPPRIAATGAQWATEWPGEWASSPHPVNVWNEQSHEWTTWWKAEYTLPLTARVVRGLERIRSLPQEEW